MNCKSKLDSRLDSKTPALARGEVIALAVIMALAAYLRLAHLEYAQMRADDINLWNIVADFLQNPQILYHGIPSSVGPPNGPFQAYLLLLATPFTRDPIGAYAVVASLNIAAVLVTWGFSRAYFGRTVALLTALLYAVNPWAVIFSRRLWGNDMMPLFTILLIWSLCNLIARGRKKDSFLPFLWLAILVQTYVGALLHVSTMLIGLTLGARRLHLRWLFSGIALSVLLLGPYATAVIPGVDTVKRLVEDSEFPTTVDAGSLQLTFHIVGNAGYQAFANQAGGVYDATSGLPLTLNLLQEGLLLLGLGVAFARLVGALRRRDTVTAAPYLIMIVPLALPALLFVRHALPAYPYYLIVGYPMHFVFSALGIHFLLTIGKRLSYSRSRPISFLPAATVGVGLVAVVAMQLKLAQIFFAVDQEYWSQSEYGLPLDYSRQVVDYAEELTASQGIDSIYVIGPHPHDQVFYGLIKRRVANVFGVNSTHTFVAPARGQALYVVYGDPDIRLAKALAGSSKKVLRTLSVPGEGLNISFISMNSMEARAIITDLGAEGRHYDFAGVARLDGSDLDDSSEATVNIRLRWTALAVDAPKPIYVYFFRLIDNANTVYDSLDVPLYFSEKWRQGDQVVDWIDLPRPTDLPPGQYWYLTGLYSSASRDTYQTLPITDGAGKMVGDSLKLGPLVVRPTSHQQPTFAVNHDFGGKITLSGYDVKPAQPHPGDTIEVKLYWQAKAAPDRDYTVFTQLINEKGQIVAQNDSQPDGGRYPTTVWRPGDQVVDPHVLNLPKELAPGQYQLATGLYYLPTGERLGGTNMAASLSLVVN
ncbi:MAG: glycosyltransferase family 39 protein [Dehalococcoidia bacterium]|nr:glycosyltransferase family 39 protein [Dehalococcoidia bacterium]